MNCQRCRTPLKLDSSLQDLNSAAFDLLVGQSISVSRSSIANVVQVLLASLLTTAFLRPAYLSPRSAEISTARYPRMPRHPFSNGSFPKPDMVSGLNLQWLLQQKLG